MISIPNLLFVRQWNTNNGYRIREIIRFLKNTQNSGGVTIVLVYVNDIIVTRNNENVKEAIKDV